MAIELVATETLGSIADRDPVEVSELPVCISIDDRG